jgi:hypothetical protein
MKPTSETRTKPGLTASELKWLQHVIAHMDDWIDDICERTDEILMSHGFNAGGGDKDLQPRQKNGRRAA